MRFIYLDNFRGFTKTSIPLSDVNFLVGENSSGKTSLLTMMRMFSSPQLIMGPDFRPGESVPFGHFGEWVSVDSENRDYFRLGMIESAANKTIPRGRGVMLTYIQDSGQPKISHLTCSIGGDREVTLKVDGDKYYFKIETCPPFKTEKDVGDRLEVWAGEHSGPGHGLRELRPPKGLGPDFKDAPLGLVLSLAASLKEKGRNAKSFSFFVPQFGPPLVWLAPIRTPPRRTYDEPHISFSPEGQHTPYVIRKMLSSERDAKRFKSFIERIGHESGLFEKIELKYFGNKNDSSSPFEIDAYLHNSPLSIGWVGYGVSQALPVLVEILHRPSGSWFAIQQPEVHLHPRAQASLGDAFFEMAASDKKRFVIETHSDFTIDRFRMNYRKRRPRTTPSPSGQVLFFQRTGGNNKVVSIPIDKQGDMSPDQPDAYREFFIREQINLLT